MKRILICGIITLLTDGFGLLSAFAETGQVRVYINSKPKVTIAAPAGLTDVAKPNPQAPDVETIAKAEVFIKEMEPNIPGLMMFLKGEKYFDAKRFDRVSADRIELGRNGYARGTIQIKGVSLPCESRWTSSGSGKIKVEFYFKLSHFHIANNVKAWPFTYSFSDDALIEVELDNPFLTLN